MADISKIQIGSTTYNIKDETARNASALSDTGWVEYTNSSVYTNSIKIRKIGTEFFYIKGNIGLVNNYSGSSLTLLSKPTGADPWISMNDCYIPAFTLLSSTNRWLSGFILCTSNAITFSKASDVDSLNAGAIIRFYAAFAKQ